MTAAERWLVRPLLRSAGHRASRTLAYGYSDCHTIRDAYGTTAYGFIPFRHADAMVNLVTKHVIDERVLIADLLFETEAAMHIAHTIGSLVTDASAAV